MYFYAIMTPHNHYSLKRTAGRVYYQQATVLPLMSVPQLWLKKSLEKAGHNYDTSLGGDMKPLVLGDLVFNTWHTQLL